MTECQRKRGGCLASRLSLTSVVIHRRWGFLERPVSVNIGWNFTTDNFRQALYYYWLASIVQLCRYYCMALWLGLLLATLSAIYLSSFNAPRPASPGTYSYLQEPPPSPELSLPYVDQLFDTRYTLFCTVTTPYSEQRSPRIVRAVRSNPRRDSNLTIDGIVYQG